MSYQILFEERPAFLHATVTGTNSPQAVAVNRGMPVRAFSNAADAAAWLESLPDGAAEHELFGERG